MKAGGGNVPDRGDHEPRLVTEDSPYLEPARRANTPQHER
jgi:hypothetical protein